MASHGTSFRFPAKSSMVLIHNLLEAYTTDGTCTSHTEFAAICHRFHRDPVQWFCWECVTTSEKICDELMWMELQNSPRQSLVNFQDFDNLPTYSSCTLDLLMRWTVMCCFYLIGVVAGEARRRKESSCDWIGRNRRAYESKTSLRALYLWFIKMTKNGRLCGCLPYSACHNCHEQCTATLLNRFSMDINLRWTSQRAWHKHMTSRQHKHSNSFEPCLWIAKGYLYICI